MTDSGEGMKENLVKVIAGYDAVFLWKDIMAAYTEQAKRLYFMKGSEVAFDAGYEDWVMGANEIEIRSDIDIRYGIVYVEKYGGTNHIVKTDGGYFHWYNDQEVYRVGEGNDNHDYDIAFIPTVRADGKTWFIGVNTVTYEPESDEAYLTVDIYADGVHVKSDECTMNRKFSSFEPNTEIVEYEDIIEIHMVTEDKKDRIRIEILTVDTDNKYIIPDELAGLRGTRVGSVDAEFVNMERIK